MEANLHPNELHLLYFFIENYIWTEYLPLGIASSTVFRADGYFDVIISYM